MTKIVGLFCVVVYLLCGCTLNKTPSNRTTFDGLELVKSNGKQQQVWAYPGVDLSSYKSIVFRGAGIQFRPAKRTSLLRPDQTDFFISEENRQRLLQIVTEEFREELIKVSGFSVINEPEPDSLLLIISLIDVVSHVPERPKRNTIFLSDAGAATLILEFKDATTGTTLVRVAERRAAQRRGMLMMKNSPVSSWPDIRKLAKSWALRMRQGIDNLGTNP